MSWFDLFYASLSLILGAAIGSFLNVVVYRLPEGLSLIAPPSYCPKCYTRLAVKDNIPIFGWLLLQGQCRYCDSPISLRYPLVELLTSMLFGLAFLIFGYSWMTLGAFLFIALLLALAFIDLDHMVLPNALNQWGLIAGLIFQGGLGVIQANNSWTGFLPRMMEALFAGVAGV